MEKITPYLVYIAKYDIMTTVKIIYKPIKNMLKLVRKKMKSLPIFRKTLIIASPIFLIAAFVFAITLFNAQNQVQGNVSTTTDNKTMQNSIPNLLETDSPALNNKDATDNNEADTGAEPGAVENTLTPGPMPGTFVEPDFHIRTPLSMTVGTDQWIGPFTAYTSDGSSVTWETPAERGSTNGVYGYTMEPLPHETNNMQYYIRANDYAKPGTYFLYITARKNQNPPMSSSIRLSVTVTGTPHFTIAFDGDNYVANIENGNVVQIPYRVHRFYGYGDTINIGAHIHYAEYSTNLDISVVETSPDQGYVLFDGKTINGVTSPRKYTVTISGYYSSTIQSSDTATISIPNQ